VFVALIAGSSLRPRFAAAELPEPAAWTHGAHSVQPDAGQLRLHPATEAISHLAQGISPDSAPTNKKPFHSMWMTHDRPASWAHLSPQLGWSVLPASFAASDIRPFDAQWAAVPVAPVTRDLATRLCVNRC
jgi:hypothetical protein